jgi:hypothetical protein
MGQSPGFLQVSTKGKREEDAYGIHQQGTIGVPLEYFHYNQLVVEKQRTEALIRFILER